MDSFSFTNIQAEKANAILKYHKLRRIANLFRLIEVCVVLVFISRLSFKLPVAVRNSSEYFKDLSLFMNSPRFVFLIGNVIIITLFVQFSAQGSGRNVPESDLYQEFVQNNTKYPEKQIIGNRRYSENHGINSNQRNDVEEQRMKTGDENMKKGYRRCETEILRKRRRVLRRCESENRRKSIALAAPVEISYPEDHLSSEEFRLTVEAFIARQQRIRREEDYSLV